MAGRELIEQLRSADLALQMHSVSKEDGPYADAQGELAAFVRKTRNGAANAAESLGHAADAVRPYTIASAEKYSPRIYNAPGYQFFLSLGGELLGGGLLDQGATDEAAKAGKNVFPPDELPSAGGILASVERRIPADKDGARRIAVFDHLEAAIVGVGALRMQGMEAYPVLFEDPYDKKMSAWPAFALLEPYSDIPLRMVQMCRADRRFTDFIILSDEAVQSAAFTLQAIGKTKGMMARIVRHALGDDDVSITAIATESHRISELLGRSAGFWADSPLLADSFEIIAKEARDTVGRVRKIDRKHSVDPAQFAESFVYIVRKRMENLVAAGKNLKIDGIAAE